MSAYISLLVVEAEDPHAEEPPRIPASSDGALDSYNVGRTGDNDPETLAITRLLGGFRTMQRLTLALAEKLAINDPTAWAPGDFRRWLHAHLGRYIYLAIV